LDVKSLNLGGESKWIRSNLLLYSKPASFKAHDWLEMMKWSSEYVFEGLYQDDVRKMDMLSSLLQAFRACLDGSSAHDTERGANDALKLQVLEALLKCEALLPATEAPPMLHVLFHVPDAMARWSSPRNFWSYFGERYVEP
jgi:hypothetical protein